MKPAPFHYHAAGTVEEILDLAGRHGADGRILAGGQSLVPLMNMRQVRVGHLIDLNGVTGLDHLRAEDGEIVIGALVRQADALASQMVRTRTPLLADALQHVANPTVRNRGTICGSIAFAQPGAELPAAALALGGDVVLARTGGTRRVAVETFFKAEAHMTAMEPGEIVREVRLRACPSTAGHAFLEVDRLGFPVVAVAAMVELAGDVIDRCRVALTGLGAPTRLLGVEKALTGAHPGDSAVQDAIRTAVEGSVARETVHGTAAYHRHVAGVLVPRALAAATSRAREALG